jgi:hypothetical protein
MKFREPKTIIRNLFNKYAKVVDNVVYAEKIFVINAVVNYIYRDSDKNKVDKDELMFFGEAIDRYLKNEVDISFKNGSINVTEPKTRGE